MTRPAFVDDVLAARAAADRSVATGAEELLDHVLASRERAFAHERAVGAPLDPFEIFGRRNHEVTHSAVLRWLLDARGTHGLGDAFSSAFLTAIGRPLPPGRSTAAVEVRGAESILDIVVEWPTFVLGIETKVFFVEGTEQTSTRS